MSVTKIIKSPKTAREVVLDLDFGADLKESEEKYGAQVVYSLFVRMCLTDAGNKARALLNEAGNPVDQIKEKIEAWIPGVASIGGIVADPTKTIAQRIANGDMTDEEIEETKRAVAAAIKARKQG